MAMVFHPIVQISVAASAVRATSWSKHRFVGFLHLMNQFRFLGMFWKTDCAGSLADWLLSWKPSPIDGASIWSGMVGDLVHVQVEHSEKKESRAYLLVWGEAECRCDQRHIDHGHAIRSFVGSQARLGHLFIFAK